MLPVPASLQVLELALRDIPGGFVVVGGLRSLQELRVHGAAGDIDNFIRGIQPTRLQAVEMSWFVTQPWEGGPPQYLSSICQNLPSMTLRSLELNFGTPRSRETSPSCALTTIVEAMHPLSHLTAVALQSWAPSR